jgi:serine/threonine protein kinase
VCTDIQRFHKQEVEMEVTFDELDIGRRIGSGACSNVHLGTHVHTGALYAVKFFSIYDEAQADQLLREVSMLFAVQDCDALMTLKGAFHDEGRIGVILEVTCVFCVSVLMISL